MNPHSKLPCREVAVVASLPWTPTMLGQGGPACGRKWPWRVMFSPSVKSHNTIEHIHCCIVTCDNILKALSIANWGSVGIRPWSYSPSSARCPVLESQALAILHSSPHSQLCLISHWFLLILLLESTIPIFCVCTLESSGELLKIPKSGHIPDQWNHKLFWSSQRLNIKVWKPLSSIFFQSDSLIPFPSHFSNGWLHPPVSYLVTVLVILSPPVYLILSDCWPLRNANLTLS